MTLNIRRTFVQMSEHHDDGIGPAPTVALRKLAVISVVVNPFTDRYVEDLKPLIDASVSLGNGMAKRAIAAFGSDGVQSYGKGGIVGVAGEQEHANALLTSAFADPFRKAIGGGQAWISSVTKVAPAGTLIDIPMNHKDDVYVRSHYDAMSIVLPDAPAPDEIAVIFCIANRGRVNARVGGLTHEEVIARLPAGAK